MRALQDDRLVRADTCFWRSLKFKSSSCVNTDTWSSRGGEGGFKCVCVDGGLHLPITLSVPASLTFSVSPIF